MIAKINRAAKILIKIFKMMMKIKVNHNQLKFVKENFLLVMI